MSCSTAVDVKLELQTSWEMVPEEYIFRIQFTVGVVQNIPKEIFVYQRGIQCDSEETFHNVATPDQISQFPIDSPEGDCPFFRKYEAAFEFDTLSEAEEYVDRIRNEIDLLVREYKAVLENINKVIVEIFPLSS